MLNTIDKEFAEAFSDALKKIELNLHINYIKKAKILMLGCENKKFATWYKSLTLRDIKKIVEPHIADFIRGFYDSEGSYVKHDDGYIAISMWNTRLDLLKLMENALRRLGFNMKILLAREAIENPNRTINGRKIKRTKRLYALKILGGKTETTRFIDVVKPTIPRKVGAHLRPIPT